jgi:phosphoribosylformylglycinamidine synthase
LIRAGKVKSAHDCSEGGLAVALAECCIGGNVGAEIQLGATGLRTEQALFNESQSRIVITVAAGDADAVLATLAKNGVPAQKLGTVGGDQLAISVNGQRIVWPVEAVGNSWGTSIGRAMEA